MTILLWDCDAQRYGFDVGGWVVVRGALSQDEVAQCLTSVAAFQQGELVDEDTVVSDIILNHETPKKYLEQMLGKDYYLDQPLRLLEQVDSVDAEKPLQGGATIDSSADHSGVGICNGVRVVFALRDAPAKAGGVVLVPATHKCHLDIPDQIRTRETVVNKDGIGLGPRDKAQFQPRLEAGDMLVYAETLVHGLDHWVADHQQCLVECTYNVRVARKTSGIKENSRLAAASDDAWWTDLPEETRAVVDGSLGPVVSDGQTSWLGPEHHHPKVFSSAPDPLVDPMEHFMWECNGYLIVRGVMDQDWIDHCNFLVDKYQDRWTPMIESGTEHPSPKQAGTPRHYLTGVFALPKPDCDPFQKMIAHPAVVNRLNWIMGGGFRLAGDGSAISFPLGTEGIRLHGNGTPTAASYGGGALNMNGYGSYRNVNGRNYTACVNVTWCLTDVDEGDGTSMTRTPI